MVVNDCKSHRHEPTISNFIHFQVKANEIELGSDNDYKAL